MRGIQTLGGGVLLVLLSAVVESDHETMVQPASSKSSTAAFVAYYWKARPGRTSEYNDYIQKVAEPIDEDARRAGIFEEVRTVMPVVTPDSPAPEWTHLRIFRLKNMEAVAQLSVGLDAATQRVVSDAAQRKANTARSAELRDLVRREVWTELR